MKLNLIMRMLISVVLVCVFAASGWGAAQTAPPPPPPQAPPPDAPPQPPADVSVFYDGLAPYGEWIKVDRYGWVWRPRGVPVDWRPYTTGHWVYTEEYGWMWAADEPWGWATFHYGRWYWNDGWCWVPGSVWGPAWVSWREGGGCIGWCPLPPEVGWRADVGLEFGSVRLDFIEHEHPCWSFVEERFITEPVLHEHIIVAARNTTLIERTREITKIREENGRIVDESLSVRNVEQVTGRPVEHVHVREVQTVREISTPHPGDRDVTIFRRRINENERISPASESINRNVNAEETQRRQEREMADLQARQETERRSLEDQERREMSSPPDGVTTEDIQRQHEVERRMQQEEHRRDIDIQKRWHERERERIHMRH